VFEKNGFEKSNTTGDKNIALFNVEKSMDALKVIPSA